MVLPRGSVQSSSLCGVIVGILDWEYIVYILCVGFVWRALVVAQGRQGVNFAGEFVDRVL